MLETEASEGLRAHPANLKHQYRSEYSSWKNARARCYSPANPSFKYVGAKGIAMCDRWRDSFAAFLNDMGPKPTESHTIERKNNALGYCPENCRWATPSEQQHNTKKCRWIEHRGKRLLIDDWAKLTGLAHQTITRRLDTLGWSVAMTLETPPQNAGNRYGNRTSRKRTTSQFLP
jgi:hypothetical protein